MRAGRTYVHGDASLPWPAGVSYHPQSGWPQEASLREALVWPGSGVMSRKAAKQDEPQKPKDL
jgi:hypothetical protein